MAVEDTLPSYIVTEKNKSLENKLDTADSFVHSMVQEVLDKGYCVIPGAVNKSIIEASLLAFDHFKQVAVKVVEPTEAGKYRRIVNLHCLIPELAELFTLNKGCKVLDALLGQPATLYTSLFFEIGSAQPLHRDTPYFWTNPAYAYFGMWTALEAVDNTNGALEILERSHLLLEEDRAEIGHLFYQNISDLPASDQRLWTEYQDRVLKQGENLQLKRISLDLSAGDTVIWHPQTMHGGLPIVDNSKSRLSFAMHITPKNTPVYHNQAFFNPDFKMADAFEWNYSKKEGREFIHHESFSFEHVHEFSSESFFTDLAES